MQFRVHKIENILNGCLDWIPSLSPSVKIQIMGGKVCLRCKGKILLAIINKLLKKKFVDITQQCFALLPQLNFPANNLKVMGLNPGYLFKSFLLERQKLTLKKS